MKRLVIVAITLLTITVYGQRPTNNPFSRFGVGELFYQGYGLNWAMGHTGIATYSAFYYSKLNPASYSSMGPQHVVFDFGINYTGNQYLTADTTVYTNNSDFVYVSGLIPLSKKFYMSVGIIPYTAIGYTMQVTDSIYTDISSTKIQTIYDGSGGINQAYFGLAFKPFRNLSIGTNLYFRWGTFNRDAYSLIDETAFDRKIENYKTLINWGFGADFGAILTDTIFNKENRNVFRYVIGAVYSPQANMKGLFTQKVFASTRYYGNSFEDTLLIDTLLTYSYPLAESFGFGISTTFWDKLTLEINYYQQNWEGLDILDQKQYLRNSKLYAFGLQYVRDPYSTRYWYTIRYRLGFFYHQTYLKLNNTPIDQYGLTFGLGLPAKSALINLNFEIGQKGTTINGLFQERYFLFTLSLTMHDIWFIRRKFL